MLQNMRLIQAIGLAAVVTLAGCGGSNSTTTTNNAPVAFAEMGQADFLSLSPNRNAVAAANTLAAPTGSVATNGTLFYVADTNNNRILGYRTPPAVNGKAADFVIGQPDFATTTAGTGTAAVLGLAHPSKVFISTGTGAGKLVVTDTANNRVLIWNSLPNPAGTSFTTPPDVVIGQADKVSHAAPSPPTAASLNNPVGAMLVNNQLFVADTNNNRALIYNTLSTGAAASVVIGQPDFVTTTILAAGANTLRGPADVWSDGFLLLVSDRDNNRVLFWNQVPTTNGAAANIALGQTSLTGTVVALGGASSMRTPTSVSSDGQRIFVADSGNNRVLLFNGFPIASGAAAYQAYGQGDLLHYTANDDDQNNGSDVNSSGQPVASSRTLSTPTGVYAFNAVVYVSDTFNNRLMHFSY